MKAYAWIIDKDHIADAAYTAPCNCNAVGLTGPRAITPEMAHQLKTDPKAGRKFKMFDDDGELYYEGRLLGDNTSDFEPLNDFGAPNAGCTYIKYKNKNGKWEIL